MFLNHNNDLAPMHLLQKLDTFTVRSAGSQLIITEHDIIKF